MSRAGSRNNFLGINFFKTRELLQVRAFTVTILRGRIIFVIQSDENTLSNSFLGQCFQIFGQLMRYSVRANVLVRRGNVSKSTDHRVDRSVNWYLRSYNNTH